MGTRSYSFPGRCSSGLPIFALGVVGLIGGVVRANPAMLAFGVLFSAAPVVIFIWLLSSARRIRVSRRAPDAVFEGDSVTVRLELKNESRQVYFFPQVCEIFQPEIQTQKGITFSGRLKPGESTVQGYLGYCILPRDVYQLGPAYTRLTDPFGWFDMRRVHRATQMLKVYPKIPDLSLSEQLGKCIATIVNDRTRRGIGDSKEFHTVREYRPGDSPRRVHWGLTARFGYPVIREFARTSVGDMAILIDSHCLSLCGFGRSSSVEYAVKIAAGVASHALKRGRRVDLILADGERPAVFEATSRDQFKGLLDELVGFRARGSGWTMTDLLGEASRLVPRGATVVVCISPYCFKDVAFRGTLERWVHLGYRVIAVLFDAPGFSFQMPNYEPGEDVYQHALELKRAGVETFVLSCGDPVEMVFPATDSHQVGGGDLR